MKQQSVNTFEGGLNFDLNPLTTPNNILTDAVNASFLTFNGDELALQNDAGNTKILVPGTVDEYIELSPGFYPLGMKEYGGVLYIISAKLSTISAEDIPEHVDGTSYSSGTIVKKTMTYINSQNIETIESITYYKKSSVSGSNPLPIESDQYWEVIGTKEDYNNLEGQVEIGSYPSPEGSSSKDIEGNEIFYGEGEITLVYRWFPTGSTWCELDTDGNNTGYLFVDEKQQSSDNNGETWIDLDVPTRVSRYLATGTCPLPIYRLAVAVGLGNYNLDTEVNIPYIENTVIEVNSPTLAGYNYIFFSIPSNKSFIIRNYLNMDITSEFVSNLEHPVLDVRPGYKVNTIHKKQDGFDTSLSTKFYLTIS